jgi:high-affinity nickel-transport protein
MCLLDTTDGALMMTLYTSTSLAKDTVAILYYSIVLSAITVLVAMVIGMIQLLSVIANYSSGPFWDGVNSVGDHFDVIGGGICGAFVVFGAASVLLYKPWRRRYDRRSRVMFVEAVELQTIDVKEVDEKEVGTRSLREEQTCQVDINTHSSEAYEQGVNSDPR